MKNWDVIVIGGGIIGLSLALELRKKSASVLIVERGEPGREASWAAGGMLVDCSLETPTALQPLATASASMYPEFVHELRVESGLPIDLRDQGAIVFPSTQHLDDHSGSALERLVCADLAELEPAFAELDRPALLLKESSVDPRGVTAAALAAAKHRGVDFSSSDAVTAVNLADGRVCGVTTRKTSFHAPKVVNCAGAWAAEIAGMVGIPLPVEPLRRMLVPTEPFPQIAHEAPMTIDMATGFHFRPEGLGLLLAWNDPDEKPGFKTTFDSAFVEKILMRAVERVPCFEDLQVNPARGWAGLYEMTPDHHAILGPVPQVPGLFLANGFSGHGVMHSPATGKILADLILNGTSSLVDTRALGIERFAEGRLIEESAVL